AGVGADLPAGVLGGVAGEEHAGVAAGADAQDPVRREPRRDALTACVRAFRVVEPVVLTPPVWSSPSPREKRRPAYTSVRCRPP
ncbi:hypothetical protein, partial [Thioalkalivibrio sp.]|uniref:hypothetical protein n=1 Tax=Thioalkalivibrio sp. TaxID=2093813 RepID=UPI0039759E03